MKKSTTMVHYFVPEDLDDQEQLNGFIISKNIDDVTLGDIKKNFPLQGQYIFRFKHQFDKSDSLGSILEKKQYVWLDVQGNELPAPQINNKIIMKATRISWHDKSTQQQKPQQKVEEVQNNITKTQKTQVKHQTQQNQQKTLHHSSSEQQMFQKQAIKKPLNNVGHSDGDLIDFGNTSQSNQTQNNNNINNKQPQNNLHKSVSAQQQNQLQNNQSNNNDLMDFGDFGDTTQNSNNNNNQQNTGQDLLDF